MQLLSESQSVYDTTYRAADGSAAYVIKSDGRKTTQLAKLNYDGRLVAVGTIIFHTSDSDEVLVHGRQVSVYSPHSWTR